MTAPPRPARALALSLAVGVLALLGPAAARPALAHHVGAYIPQDNEVTASFRQVKFSVQARKFDVALRLFEAGALRREMRAKAAGLPPGLEAATREALRAGDAAEAERLLMVFFAALGRDLALEAERQVGDSRLSRKARLERGERFLEAIWRYYNLVDFVVSQQDSKASVAIRLAFDEAESVVKGPAAPGVAKVPAPGSQPPAVAGKAPVAPAAGSPVAGARPPGAAAAPPDPERLRPPFRRIAGILSALIETSSPSASSTGARRNP
jgi:hypothetical protein